MRINTKKTFSILLFLLVAGHLCGRLLLIYFDTIPQDIFGYDWELYEVLGDSIRTGNGFSVSEENGGFRPTFTRPPLFPMFIALLRIIWGEAAWVVPVAHAMLAVLTLLLVIRISLQYGKLTTIFAAGILAVNPMYFLVGFSSMSETLSAFLVILSFYLYLEFRKKGRTKYSFLTGIVLGLVVLTRMNLLPILGLVLLIEMVRNKKQAVIVFISASFIVVPWVARNVYHGFHGASTTLGINITVLALRSGALSPSELNNALWPYIDLNDYNSSLEEIDGAGPLWRPFQDGDYQRDSGLSEPELNELFVRIGKQALRDQPMLAIKAVLSNSWQFANNHIDRNMGMVGRIFHLLSFGVFLLSCYALYDGVRKRQLEILVGFGYILFPVLLMMFVTFIYHRYRIPLDPIIAILAALGIRQIFEKFGIISPLTKNGTVKSEMKLQVNH